MQTLTQFNETLKLHSTRIPVSRNVKIFRKIPHSVVTHLKTLTALI